MNKYTIEQVAMAFGSFRSELYRRAIGFQMSDIIARIDGEMDAQYGI